MNGLLAALLAREGFTGSVAMLDGPGSLAETYLGVSDLSPAVEDFGKRWQLLDNSTKFYAACHLTHATIDAARGIRAHAPLAADAIERVECRVHPLVMKVANQQSPRTDLEAKFSIAFCAAIALLRGDAGEAEFDAAAVADPDVARLTARVTPEPDPSMPIVAAHMTVRLRDGRVLEHHVTAARGTPEHPPSRDDVEEKFRRVAQVVLPADRVSRLLTTLRGLVDLRDVSEIATLAAG
jgi:2-methylcitrate dehydratase PrpD